MDGNNTLLDGFIVRDAAKPGYAIYGQNINFTVENCIIEENQEYGLLAENSNLIVQWCTIKNNSYDGIRHTGNNSKSITIENCQVSYNGQNGINTQFSIPSIRNNQINFNGVNSFGTNLYYGLFLFYPQTGYDVRNNTVIYNVNEGIYINNSSAVDIRNCILYGNKEYSEEQFGGNITAHYSCVWDPNNIYTTPDGNHNISCDPLFAYDGNPNAKIYHLLPPSAGFAGSPCIDRGDNTGVGFSEKDIDGEARWMGEYVDMGADELDPECVRIYHPLDWNADGLINYEEFRFLSAAWMSHDPNDPAWLADPELRDPGLAEGWYEWKYQFNLDTDGDSAYSIDLADLLAFVNDWLWTACWRTDLRNPMDWDGDGLVNYHEFQYFAKAWLSNPGSLSWDSRCNLNRDTNIDLADLILFLEDGPWLWAADYNRAILRKATVIIMPQAVPPQTPPQDPPQEPNIIPEPELSIEEQIAQLQEAIAFFENLWETDPNIQQEIPAEEWQEFMDTLYAELAYLQSLLEPWDPNEIIFDPNDPNSPFYGMGMMMFQSEGWQPQIEGMWMDISTQQEISELQDSIQFLESLWDDPQFRQEMQADDWQAFMNEVYKSLTEMQKNDIITQ